MMENLLHKAAAHLNRKLPFALFRKPGSTSVTGIFQLDARVHVTEDFRDSGFVFAPFSGKAILLPEALCEVESAVFEPEEIPSGTPELMLDSAAKLAFEQLVSKAVSAIKEGELSKVVLSRPEVVNVQDFDAIRVFGRLASTYPTAFAFLWHHPETGIWMAATPEKLLEANGKRFSTMALAGTQKFQGEADVAWENKEKEEQRFVTDFIWNGLEDVASEIELGPPYTFRAGNLLHIRTDIEGELRSEHDIDRVIRILHPTPAVCGLPKEKARDFILLNEGYEREFYSGFMGELNMRNGTDLYVNLRCMKVSGEKATLFVGCGITRDSDPEKEFFETVNKSLTIRKVLENNTKKTDHET